MEHGPEHPRNGRGPVPRHETDHDAVPPPDGPDAVLRAGVERSNPVPRSRTQRTCQLLYAMRRGGNKHLFNWIRDDQDVIFYHVK